MGGRCGASLWLGAVAPAAAPRRQGPDPCERGDDGVIVRILGEGQFDLEGEALQALKLADARLFEVVAGEDEDAFQRAFGEVLALVRRSGQRLPPERLVESDLVLPSSETTLVDARRLFTAHPT